MLLAVIVDKSDRFVKFLLTIESNQVKILQNIYSEFTF